MRPAVEEMTTAEQRRFVKISLLVLVLSASWLVVPPPSDDAEPTKILALLPLVCLIATGIRISQVRPALRASGAPQARQALIFYGIAGTLCAVATVTGLLLEELLFRLLLIAAGLAALTAEFFRAGVQTKDRPEQR